MQLFIIGEATDYHFDHYYLYLYMARLGYKIGYSFFTGPLKILQLSVKWREL